MPAPPTVAEVLRSPGRPLDRQTQAFMEPRFGHDFSRVRVHTDTRAAESARAIAACAYTVGPRIVFGSGLYSPGTAAGRKLLAHELAHVLQQASDYPAGGPAATPSTGIGPAGTGARGPEEVEAERISAAALAGRAVGTVSDAPVSLQRQEMPQVDAETREAQRAAVVCDIPALCRLRRSARATVTDEWISTVATRCRPDVLILGDPCLTPALMLSPGAYTAPPPARSTAGTAGAGGPGGSLAELTSFSFSLGAARFEVSLPSSVTARLPIPLRGSRTLEFVLIAQTSGNFSFSIRINGLRHLRIEATAGVEVGERSRGSTGLTISTTRTVCRAMEPATAREQLQGKGVQLRDAIRNLQSPPAPEPGAEPVETPERLVDVVSAIADIYQTVETARAACRQVPVASIGITGGMLLGEREETPAGTTPEERKPGWSFGGTLTFHF